uniref:Uncharacterized protein n=1 Tax=Corethron hystrix TaxID=216773 RepID=A0A7S1BA25_9STRA|mmetsp:Transcript_17212/g.38778  ORF Transcript_17212/g.38778 Transcript_17212/m.38778 type:complete len:271 (+) Transcript_17212:230-1042(+)
MKFFTRKKSALAEDITVSTEGITTEYTMGSVNEDKDSKAKEKKNKKSKKRGMKMKFVLSRTKSSLSTLSTKDRILKRKVSFLRFPKKRKRNGKDGYKNICKDPEIQLKVDESPENEVEVSKCDAEEIEANKNNAEENGKIEAAKEAEKKPEDKRDEEAQEKKTVGASDNSKSSINKEESGNGAETSDRDGPEGPNGDISKDVSPTGDEKETVENGVNDKNGFYFGKSLRQFLRTDSLFSVAAIAPCVGLTCCGRDTTNEIHSKPVECVTE